MVNAIYIHIPFCEKKCEYCDFLSFKNDNVEKKRYVDYLIKEINLYPNFKFDTIYFGGGTPSLLNIEDIELILNNLNYDKNCEITLEVNPKTINYEKLLKLKSIGINRLSIGIQSFNNKTLSLLGRIHDKNEAIQTYYDARKVGFNNISLDLMFSLPNQTIEDVLEDLKTLFQLNPEHFSIYSLIWEEGTPFYKKLEDGIYSETDNEVEAEMFEMILDEAKKNNYLHYEISNFCKNGFESKHNMKYWKNEEYLGVGLGASGYIKNIRYKNIVQFSQYYDSIDRKLYPILEKEIVNENSKKEYYYILGLRLLNEGVAPLEEYEKKCKFLLEKGLLKIKDNKYILSKKGLMLANDVLSEFI